MIVLGPFDPSVWPNLVASLYWALVVLFCGWLAKRWIRSTLTKVMHRHVVAPLKEHIEVRHNELHDRLDAAGIPRPGGTHDD